MVFTMPSPWGSNIPTPTSLAEKQIEQYSFKTTY